jgi:DNA-binding Lrp family transcriptional regulator
MKNTELRLISELMKNSRRSDRELARVLRVSQPTVTRIRTRLEKEGIVKEYTMIPDFAKLGYEIMGVTLAKTIGPEMGGSAIESRRAIVETEQRRSFANLIGLKGTGLGKDAMFITLYKSYSAYVEAIQVAKQIPHYALESFESFLVDLTDKDNYRVLTLAQVARHILSSEESAKT